MTTNPEAEHRHPWDDAIDSSMEWTDQLVSTFDGKTVFVTRNMTPESQSERIRLIFPDGSRLYIGVDGWVPMMRDERHWTQHDKNDAAHAASGWVKALYADASAKEVDVDGPPNMTVPTDPDDGGSA